MAKKPVEVVAGIIFNNHDILLHQRGKGDALEGSWEFPGGKVKKGESHQKALIREIQEELNLTIEVQEKLGEITYNYPHIHIRLVAYKALSEKREAECTEGNFQWVSPREVAGYTLSPADKILWRNISDALVK
jgi:8-oxo-dGTP diphosphatase